MEIMEINVNLPIALHKDGDSSMQPENTYKDARNAIIFDSNGDIGIRNEKGHLEKLDFGTFVPLGAIKANNEMFVPLTNLGISDPNGNDKILLIDNNGNSREFYQGNLFGFDSRYPINGECKLNSKGERIVYFTDNNTNPKVVNIDEPSTNLDNQDVSLFLLFNRPEVSLTRINDFGGFLPTGAYYIGIQLLDENFNSTNTVAISNPIFIVDDTKTGSIPIDGAVGNYPSTKSITFSLDDINDNIKYIKIVVAQKLNQVITYKISNSISLTGNAPYSYTISSLDNYTEISPEQAFNIYTFYNKCKFINQDRNKLILTDLSQEIEIDYQSKANDIEVNYWVEEFNLNDDDNNYRDEIQNSTNREWQRNEVYALGIVWHYDFGVDSEVFHIPGREKLEGYELSSGSVVNIGYTDQVYGSSVPKWKAENTAEAEVVPTTTLVANPTKKDYKLAYWESGELYPTDSKWGTLAGTPVRHHRMPNFAKSPSYRRYRASGVDQLIGRRLKLNITNIQTPTENRDHVSGFSIVYVKRDADNKSVISQGLLYNYTYRSSDTVINSFPWSGKTSVINTLLGTLSDTKKFASFYSAENAFSYGNDIVPDMVELDAALYDSGTVFTYSDADTYDYTNRIGHIFPSGIFTVPEANKRNVVSKIMDIPANQAIDTGSFLLDNRKSPSHTFLQTQFDIEYVDVYLAANGISLAPLTLLATGGNIISIGGQGSVYLGTLRKKYFNQYQGINNLEYITTGKTVRFNESSTIDDFLTTEELTDICGDTYLGSLFFRRTVGGNDGFYAARAGSGMSSETNVQIKILNGIPLESTVNIDFRHSGEDANPVDNSATASYYPKTPTIYDGSGNTVLEQDATVDNYWAYNKDYSSLNDLILYIPTAVEVVNRKNYPNRSIYSIDSTSEDVSDSYRLFPINNYKDLPTDKGRIINVFVDNNRIVYHMENGIYVIPGDDSTIGSSEGRITVGTGAFLARDAKGSSNLEEGFAGLINREAGTRTPYGYFFVDARRGEVFGYSTLESAPKIISEEGMFGFFRDNGKLSLEDSLITAGYENINYNPTHYNGIGYTIKYDRLRKRIILFKKDYTLKQGVNLIPRDPITGEFDHLDFVNGAFTYINGNFYRFEYSLTSIGEYTTPSIELSTGFLIYPNLVKLSNTTYFEENFFTLSYSFITKKWVSLHDYEPIFFLNLFDLYSTNISDNGEYKLYQHGQGNYGVFPRSGTPYKFILDIVFNKPKEIKKLFNSISVKSQCYDSNDIVKKDFFDLVFFYNSYQASNNIDLTLNNNTRNHRNYWNINKIRDYVNDQTLSFIDNNGDLISGNINAGKHYSKLTNLIDNFLRCKFTYNNSDNYKLIIREILYYYTKFYA